MGSEGAYWGKRGASERQDVRISDLESNIIDVQKSKKRLIPEETSINSRHQRST